MPAGTGWQRLRRGVGSVDALGVAGALLAACVVLSLTTESFFSTGNLLNVARRASEYGIIAIAMVFVLAMGEVDLSVGAIVTLVNVVTALALRGGAAVPLAIVIGLAAGTFCGMLNGLFSVAMRVPVIIVTLGTMSLYRGLAIGFSESQPVTGYPKTGWFFAVFGENVAGVPVGVWAMLVFCLLGYVLFNHTAFGWRVQAIGSNRQAARFSGIPIRRYKVAVAALTGAVCAVVALIALAFHKSGDSTTAAAGFELYVIASAIIGGTSLSGGSGSIAGAVLGALLLAVIDNGLGQFEIPLTNWNQAITGAVILLAVGVSALIKRSGSQQRELA
jgi:ribose transport system permease protein